MSKQAENLVGRRFGKWVVIESSKLPLWKCKCDCGSISIVDGSNLRSGKTSCCYQCGRKKTRKFTIHEKYCPCCKDWLPLEEFADEPTNLPSGKRGFCFICDAARRHHITKKNFLDMVDRQNNKCAIIGCDRQATHIDHNHKCCPGKHSCGKCIRGVLCAQHNTGLGGFLDDPFTLRSAACYIEGYERKGSV